MPVLECQLLGPRSCYLYSSISHLAATPATMTLTTMAVCANLLALSVVFVLVAQSGSSTVADVSGFYADNGLQVCILIMYLTYFS